MNRLAAPAQRINPAATPLRPTARPPMGPHPDRTTWRARSINPWLRSRRARLAASPKRCTATRLASGRSIPCTTASSAGSPRCVSASRQFPCSPRWQPLERGEQVVQVLVDRVLLHAPAPPTVSGKPAGVAAGTESTASLNRAHSRHSAAGALRPLGANRYSRRRLPATGAHAWGVHMALWDPWLGLATPPPGVTRCRYS